MADTLDIQIKGLDEIERRLQIAAKASATAPSDSGLPVGVPESFDEHIKLQFDLLALAFQADITRVGSLLFARDLTGRTYPESEAPTQGFHGLSHHGNDPEAIANLITLETYQIEHFGKFVARLSKMKDGDRSLLDSTTVLFGSGMGKELAEAAGGKYVQLPKASDQAIAAIALEAISIV